jgi:hypothetical protein
LGQLFAITASYSDPGTSDTHTATIDWGDGTVTNGVVNQGTRQITGSHRYVTLGDFTATVTVTDDDGGGASDSFTVAVRESPTQTVQFASGTTTVIEGSVWRCSPSRERAVRPGR